MPSQLLGRTKAPAFCSRPHFLSSSKSFGQRSYHAQWLSPSLSLNGNELDVFRQPDYLDQACTATNELLDKIEISRWLWRGLNEPRPARMGINFIRFLFERSRLDPHQPDEEMFLSLGLVLEAPKLSSLFLIALSAKMRDGP